MSKMYKRTCLQCGNVWHSSKNLEGVGWFVSLVFHSFAAAIINRRGSYIDVKYATDQSDRKRNSCPVCGSTIVRKEEIDVPKEEINAPKDVTERKIQGNEKVILFFISLFLGTLGIDRFYAGKNVSGILKLLTLGGCGIWYVVDLCNIAKGEFTTSNEYKPMTPRQKKGCISCFVVLLVVIIIAMISQCVSEKAEEKGKNEKDSATIERASSLLQSSEELSLARYEQALDELNSISSNYEKYNEVQELKYKIDSLLSEKSYERGKKLFEEGEYGRAESILMKVNSNHKNYEKARNMIEKADKITKIGEQTWMAENLSYNAKGSKCLYDKPENCEKYGRLYNWATAMKACPSGWHLPSDDEWGTLYSFAGSKWVNSNDNLPCGGYLTAGKYLKAKKGWNIDGNVSGNGDDILGFSALPGGWSSYSSSIGKFKFMAFGSHGFWWSSSKFEGSGNCPKENDFAACHEMGNYLKDVIYSGGHKGNMYSVRCVKD